MSDYEEKLRRLLDVGRALVGEVDPEAVLTRILDEARELTGARYAALGVPIVIRGEAWGNLYLAEKEGGGEFTEEDADAVVALSQWAATAIGNARLYQDSERRRDQLERAVRSLEAARDVADAITGASDLERILELIVKRGRALVDARTVLIMLREGDELVVAASAGNARGAPGHRIPMSRSTSGEVLERGRPERLADAGARLRIAPEELGVRDARTALIVPVVHRGNGLGVLAAFDRGPGGARRTGAQRPRSGDR